jgi:hypothetical protein
VSVPPSSSSLTTRWPPGATTPASTSENAAVGVVSYHQHSRHTLAQLLTASRAYARCVLQACSPASRPASLAYAHSHVPPPPQTCSCRRRLLAIVPLRPIAASHSAPSLHGLLRAGRRVGRPRHHDASVQGRPWGVQDGRRRRASDSRRPPSV